MKKPSIGGFFFICNAKFANLIIKIGGQIKELHLTLYYLSCGDNPPGKEIV